MKPRFSIMLSGAALTVLLSLSLTCQAASNLLFNGSFDYPTNPLAGWNYDFQWLGNGLYMDNHSHISFLEKDGSRKTVVKIDGIEDHVLLTGQGIWLDTKLVPYEYPYRYKITMWARSEGYNGGPGPDARILACALKWQPGRTPHPDPDLSEMAPKPPNRLIQQGSGNMLYFAKGGGGDTAGVRQTWAKGETTFPKKKPSTEELKRIKQTDFIFLHICALFGAPGYLYIDEVTIEKLSDKVDVDNPVKKSYTRQSSTKK